MIPFIIIISQIKTITNSWWIEFFKQDSEQTSAVLNALAESEEQLSQAYARWDELESMLEDWQQ